MTETASPVAPQRKYLVLTAMIFAVAMMFIDQTIVAIAVPAIDRDLSLSATGAQWIINGYLLALAALFALGGKLSDVLGHRRAVAVAGFLLWAGALTDARLGTHARHATRPRGRRRVTARQVHDTRRHRWQSSRHRPRASS